MSPQVEMVIEMYNRGDSLEEMIAKSGLSKKGVCNALRDQGYHASFAPYSDNNLRTYRSVVKRWEEAVGLVKPYLEKCERRKLKVR